MKFVLLALVSGLCVFSISRCGSNDTATSSSTLTVMTSLSSTRDANRSCGSGGIVCTGSPSSLTMKIYEAWVSPNADCTSATQVRNSPSGSDVSLGVDNLIQSSPSNGTYRCLILKISDNLRFVPDSAAQAAFPGICTTSTSVFDIYRTDSGDAGQWKDTAGGSITATGSGSTPGDDTVYIYATTTAAAVTGGSIGAHTNQTVTLTAPLVVPGQTTFFVDFANGVTGSPGICKIEGGTGMGFR